MEIMASLRSELRSNSSSDSMVKMGRSRIFDATGSLQNVTHDDRRVSGLSYATHRHCVVTHVCPFLTSQVSCLSWICCR